MKVIAVMNYKGGVGKTTFTACTAQALALTGFRVLAIDNDGQHDLSSMLGIAGQKPSIRDVYHASIGPAAQRLMKSIQETDIPYLHAIASENDLCNADVTDPYLLKKAFAYAMLQRFYDYVLIDNAPGMDALQMASVHVADEIFVPTELRQFATNGLRDMHQVLLRRHPDECKITRIVPTFYRDTKAQNGYLEQLRTDFPDKVVQTAIPYDNVFDEIVAEGKNLYLHRLSSRGAAYYIKLMHELFNLEEEATWKLVTSKRRQHKAQTARERFAKAKDTENVSQDTAPLAQSSAEPGDISDNDPPFILDSDSEES